MLSLGCAVPSSSSGNALWVDDPSEKAPRTAVISQNQEIRVNERSESELIRCEVLNGRAQNIYLIF